jgi:hypothetical protein
MIKTFRALIEDGGQDTIRLSTNNGMIGYRIKKFQLLPNVPGDINQDSSVQIFTREQGTPVQPIDFSNSELLAAAMYGSDNATHSNNDSMAVIFDNVIVNQDIYVTHQDAASAANPINYYIELEQIKLAIDEAAVATLRDMRGSN